MRIDVTEREFANPLFRAPVPVMQNPLYPSPPGSPIPSDTSSEDGIPIVSPIPSDTSSEDDTPTLSPIPSDTSSEDGTPTLSPIPLSAQSSDTSSEDGTPTLNPIPSGEGFLGELFQNCSVVNVSVCVFLSLAV